MSRGGFSHVIHPGVTSLCSAKKNGRKHAIPLRRSNHSPLEGESQMPSPSPELVEGPATADAVGGVVYL